MPRVSRTAPQLGLVGVALVAAVLNLGGAAQASDLYQPYGTYGPPPVVVPGPPAVVPGPVYGEPRYGPPPVVYGEPHYVPPPVVYGEPRYGPPLIERRVEIDNGCRIVHRRHIDPWGREVVRRARVCDEAVVEPHPRWVARGPRYGYDPYYAPRPPRPVQPDLYDDRD